MYVNIIVQSFILFLQFALTALPSDVAMIIKSKDSAFRRADEMITMLRNEITKLNTDLFVAHGKLTLRAAVEEVETLYVSPKEDEGPVYARLRVDMDAHQPA
jgi:hypothetical protein